MNLSTTRHSLHAVAELLIAGPQYAATGDIQLVAAPAGFAGHSVSSVRVAGTELITPTGRFPLVGTLSALAESAGITPRPLTDVYTGGPVFSAEEELDVAGPAAQQLLDAFTIGDAALRALAPEEEPILWPEHFDIGISVPRINYGVSPGDSLIGEPYAYVGPWEVPTTGAFWNQPFGAARTLSELPTSDEVLQFFLDGKAAATVGL